MERQQWTNIRGLAILCVIVIHTMTLRFNSGNDLNNLINLLFDQIARFSVPVFFMSSGFGLGIKYMEKIDILNFYGKRLTIIPEYIAWSVIYFILRSDNKSFLNLLTDIITGNASGQLYFIVVLIQFYIIFPFIRKLAAKRIGLWISFAISLISQLIFQFGFNIEKYLILNWLVYFVLGIYLSNNSSQMKKFKQRGGILFFIGTIIMLSSVFIFFIFSNRPIQLITSTMRPTMIIYSIGVMSWFLMNKPKPIKIFQSFDEHSLSIYYVHMIFLKAFFIVMNIFKIDPSNSFVLIIIAGGTIILSFVFAIFYDYAKKKYCHFGV